MTTEPRSDQIKNAPPIVRQYMDARLRELAVTRLEADNHVQDQVTGLRAAIAALVAELSTVNKSLSKINDRISLARGRQRGEL